MQQGLANCSQNLCQRTRGGGGSESVKYFCHTNADKVMDKVTYKVTYKHTTAFPGSDIGSQRAESDNNCHMPGCKDQSITFLCTCRKPFFDHHPAIIFINFVAYHLTYDLDIWYSRSCRYIGEKSLKYRRYLELIFGQSPLPIFYRS